MRLEKIAVLGHHRGLTGWCVTCSVITVGTDMRASRAFLMINSKYFQECSTEYEELSLDGASGGHQLPTPAPSRPRCEAKARRKLPLTGPQRPPPRRHKPSLPRGAPEALSRGARAPLTREGGGGAGTCGHLRAQRGRSGHPSGRFHRRYGRWAAVGGRCWPLAAAGRPPAALPAPRRPVSATSAPLRAPQAGSGSRSHGRRRLRPRPRPRPRSPSREDAAVAGGQLLRAAGGAAPLRLVLRPAGAGLPALPGVRRRGLLLGGAALRGPAAAGAGQAEAALPGGARLPLGAAAGAVPAAGAGGQQLRRLGAQQRLGQLELGLHLLPLLRQHRALHHG